MSGYAIERTFLERIYHERKANNSYILPECRANVAIYTSEWKVTTMWWSWLFGVVVAVITWSLTLPEVRPLSPLLRLDWCTENSKDNI